MSQIRSIQPYHRTFTDLSTKLPPIESPLDFYLAQHSVVHFLEQEDIPTAIQFLWELSQHSELPTIVQSSIYNSKDLLFFALSTNQSDCNLQHIVDLAIVHNNNVSLKYLSTYVVEHHLESLDDAFEEYDNLSVPFTYMLAYGLADKALRDNCQKQSEEYALKGIQGGPLAYTNLYAYKYCVTARPDWMDLTVLQTLSQGNVYDLIPVVNILLHHTLEGRPFALELNAPTFWNPVWDYNQVEIDLLKGALIFKGFQEPENETEEEYAAYFSDLENIRLRLLESASPATQTVLAHYWTLHIHTPLLNQAFGEIKNSSDIIDYLWLLLSSPYWEVQDTVAAWIIHHLSNQPIIWQDILSWTDPEESVAWGVMNVYKMQADNTGDYTPLKDLIYAHLESEDPQLRGNAVNLIYQIMLNTPHTELHIFFETWKEFIEKALNDTDIWAVQEAIEIVRHLEEHHISSIELNIRSQPMFEVLPDWKIMSWSAFLSAATTWKATQI